MPKVICELENSSTEINGIKFVPHEDGQRLISEADVGEPHLSIFLSIPGYSVDGDDDHGDSKDPEPPKAPESDKETAAQRKARLKAEKEASDKAEADRLAAEEEAKRVAAEEEAQRLAAEEAAKQSQQQGGGDTQGSGNDQGEVF